MNQFGRPPKQGLYDPAHEHDACGVGFIANIHGDKSHDLIADGIEILIRLEHRGACGCDPETGDGAGVLIQLPDGFLRKEAESLGITLPEPGAVASGMVFFSQEADARAWQTESFERIVAEEGQQCLGWRDVPVASDAIGWLAREGMPVIRQVFLGRGDGIDQDGFERKLYVIRRCFEKEVGAHGSFAYVPSLSSRTFVFAGMLIPSQLDKFFHDLKDPALESALAIVHSRYSTNTFGSWDLAQPFRYLAHNGEINTLKGNRNAMHAREGTLRSELFGEDLSKLYPLMRGESASDSAQFDNALEFLCLTGRELPEAILMMIPEAWEKHEGMSDDLRAYYEYHSFLMEPWDGPASIAFTDGRKIGAVLDRNGLRPSRWIRHPKDGLRGDGLGGGRPRRRSPRTSCSSKGRLKPGPDLLRGSRAGPHRRGRGDQVRLPGAQALPQGLGGRGAGVKLGISDLPSETPAENVDEPLAARDCGFGLAAGLRVHRLRISSS